MESVSSQEKKRFQKKILQWYSEYQRSLPWRNLPFEKTLQERDPYKILLSEIMSQQTQIARVIPKYHAWLTAFPTVQDLAKASVAEVLQHWSGLGYNRRALNLKKTAQIITEKYDGQFPRTEKELLALPGIGQYTARALLCFAFNEQVAVVDTNVRKVILTQFNVAQKDIPEFAEWLLPKGRAYEWNQALMDYAAAMLKEHKIPIPKQSKFIGSHRYYRGRVLKLLLHQKQVPIAKIGGLIKNDYSNTDKDWLENLVQELAKEGFIVIRKNTIELSS